MKMMRNFAVAAFLCAATALLWTGCSNSSSDDSGGGGNLDDSDTVAGTDYSGSFTVNGSHYSVLSLDSSAYTMAGADGSDSGTVAARSARAGISDGSYKLTSQTHKGSFILTLSGSKVSLAGDTITASGSGGNIYADDSSDLPSLTSST